MSEGGALAGDVTLPGGKRVKKVWAVAGGVGLVVVGVIWYRNHKAAQAAAAVTDSTPAAETFAPGVDLSGGGSGGGGGNVDTSVPTQVQNGPPFTNNAAWAQYATTYLVDNLNLDPGAVATDLAAYLAGDQVTQDQRNVINDALAYADYPPAAGANGYPPSINVVGSVSGLGNKPGAVQLAAGAVTASSIALTWPAVTGASEYDYTATGPGGFNRTGTLTAPGLTLSGLSAASAYAVTVHAANAAGAGPDSTLTVTTAAATSSTPTPPTPAPTGPAGAPAGATQRYTIQHGDTLSGIAAKFHVTTAQLWAWNGPDLDAYAVKMGHPSGSNHGALIFGGLPIWV